MRTNGTFKESFLNSDVHATTSSCVGPNMGEPLSFESSVFGMNVTHIFS